MRINELIQVKCSELCLVHSKCSINVGNYRYELPSRTFKTFSFFPHCPLERTQMPCLGIQSLVVGPKSLPPGQSLVLSSTLFRLSPMFKMVFAWVISSTRQTLHSLPSQFSQSVLSPFIPSLCQVLHASIQHPNSSSRPTLNPTPGAQVADLPRVGKRSLNLVV